MISVAANFVRETILLLQDQGMSLRDIAKKLKVSDATVFSYSKGLVNSKGDRKTGDPSTAVFERALAIRGGDIQRALPDFRPLGTVPLEVLGSVSAGEVRMTEAETELIPSADEVFQKSRYWTRGFGPVHYLRVDGDSMEPDYPKNSLVAVRKTNLEPGVLDPLSPVIFHDAETHEYTFKLIQVYKAPKTTTIRAIMGLPLNRTHPAIVFTPGQVRVAFVVVGQIQVAGPSNIPSTKNAGVLIAREEEPS